MKLSWKFRWQYHIIAWYAVTVQRLVTWQKLFFTYFERRICIGMKDRKSTYGIHKDTHRMCIMRHWLYDILQNKIKMNTKEPCKWLQKKFLSIYL